MLARGLLVLCLLAAGCGIKGLPRPPRAELAPPPADAGCPVQAGR